MSPVEDFNAMLAALAGRRKNQTEELSGDKNVQLWDFREPEEAKKSDVEPGLYFTISPISDPESRDPLILQKLSFSFHEKLEEEGLQGKSDTAIAVDTKYSMFVDPAQAWIFSLYGYIPDLQRLVVRADTVDRDDAQKFIVTALK